ncbi:MAG: CsbD family protein [Myxococcaceae bacterium]
MNWDQIKGQMQQVQGKLKSKWAKLTDDDLMLLKGKKDIFLGRLQERTGMKKEEAERELDSFLNDMSEPHKT